MSNIWTPKLPGLTPEEMSLAMAGIQAAIIISLADDHGNKPGKPKYTRDEVKRRFRICWDIVKQLRYDLKWSFPRINDHLPEYLRYELDGVKWEPDSRRTWIKQDGF